MKMFRFAFFVISCVTFLVRMGSSLAATKYAGEFLSLGVGARSLGMGSAFVALSDDATAGYWNAAGLPRLERREAMVMHSERFGGTINYDFISFVAPTERLGGLGVGLIRVGIDDIKYTVLENPKEALSSSNRPQVSRIVGSADYALYLSNGRLIGGSLSLGGSLKLIRRSISDNSAFGYGVDLGLLYALPWGLSIGVNLRDVTSTAIIWDTGTTDRVRPSVVVGVAYSRDLPAFASKLTGAFSSARGAGLEGDGVLNAGFEYCYRDQVALRLGSERGRLTAGAGLRLYRRFGVDLAFLEHQELDNTYRISASVQF